MKPLTLALIAGGVAAFVLLRGAAPAPAKEPGGARKVLTTLGNFFTDSGELLAWGDLSAIKSDDGRRAAFVPIEGRIDQSLTHGLSWWELAFPQAGAVMTFGEPR